MRVHMTRLYGFVENNVAYISQKKFSEIGRRLGFHDISLFRYPMETDTEAALEARLDGILSGVEDGDVVIFQSPSWNELAYDRRLLEKIKTRPHAKLIIFVEDVVPVMFHAWERLPEQVAIYNLADLLILPSQNMLDTLRGQGLTVRQVLLQPMCDYPAQLTLPRPAPLAEVHFSGSPKRFTFLEDWHYQTPLHLYAAAPPTNIAQPSVRYEGWKNETELLLALARGGFGLVWTNEENRDYYVRCQPYKFGNFLTAGIPVIVRRGMVQERLVRERHLGLAADSLEEVDAAVRAVTPQAYADFAEAVRHYQVLSQGGYITARLLLDAVVRVLHGPAFESRDTCAGAAGKRRAASVSAGSETSAPAGLAGSGATGLAESGAAGGPAPLADSAPAGAHAGAYRETDAGCPVWAAPEEDEDTVQICFGLHDADGSYSYHIAVTMQSIMEHTDARLHFHLLTDETLTEENLGRLEDTAHAGGAALSMHRIDAAAYQMTSRDFSYFTLGAMMRLFAPETLAELPKILYLDADLLVLADVADLWNINLDGYALAAVPDMGTVHVPIIDSGAVPRDYYCNSGVMLMNLDRMREDGPLIERALAQIRSRGDIMYPDQDAVSLLYWQETLLLDRRWNQFAHSIGQEEALRPCIYHYAGDILNLYHPNAVDEAQIGICTRTAYGAAPILSEYHRTVEVYNDKMQQMQQLVRRMAHGIGTKVFYGKIRSGVFHLMKLIPVQVGDVYVTDGAGEGTPIEGVLLTKPLAALSEMARGTFTLFANPCERYEEDRAYWESLGLVEGIDYFNIMRLFDRNSGGYA